jgi:hypothetical protein
MSPAAESQNSARANASENRVIFSTASARPMRCSEAQSDEQPAFKPRSHEAMKQLVRIVVGILLLLVAGFCVFGFLASFEPGIDPWHLTKAAYGVVGIGSLAATGWLIFRR